MKELDMALTILCSGKEITIELEDRLSHVRFLILTVAPEQFTSALGRLALVPCKGIVQGLDKIGKVHECRDFEFELPDNTNWSNRKEVATRIARETCPKGWIPDLYFDSQDSFNMVGEGTKKARITIRRWVDQYQKEPQT